jgi:hypothetical protein
MSIVFQLLKYSCFYGTPSFITVLKQPATERYHNITNLISQLHISKIKLNIILPSTTTFSKLLLYFSVPTKILYIFLISDI